MPVQAREHVSSSTTRYPVDIQCSMSQSGTHSRPAAASKSLPPSLILPPSLQFNTIPRKAESQTNHDGPWPTTTKLSRVFSLPRLGTNANKSREIIPVVSNQHDHIAVGTHRKRLSRHPSRRLSSMTTPTQTSSSRHSTPFTSTLVMHQPPSLSTTDIAPKNPTDKSSISPVMSVGDETDEDSNDPAAHHKKVMQMQMARLAKLTRHLGEEIPPELVLSPALPIETAESRTLTGSLSVNLSRGHQRRQSLDPTADLQSSPALSRSSTLRKSRSLRGKEGVLRLQTHGDHAAKSVDRKFPYELHSPQTEVDSLRPSEPSVSASLCGPNVGNRSLMSTAETPRGVRSHSHPPPSTMSLASTSERSQLQEDSVATDLALDDISNKESGKAKQDRFCAVDINPGTRSPAHRSLHSAGDLAVIRSSLTQSPSYSELEVDVQISRRTPFWRMKVGKDVAQSVNPDDITKQLREMKAST
ncbi:uncharacterized protein EDB91DRAFT_1242329 [Suillus paluster]|uniref:uncharacterized protein n=1 Tax=Suillus paluster TaxID=48578 RepID=UPI001B87F548|nr:uncharacterized protein EDB91DRAFT_1242329 [Suillus paluster]KAG1755121.1 hypothetical protein EDB91DRAFT_1242329 [Suillus paluster]